MSECLRPAPFLVFLLALAGCCGPPAACFAPCAPPVGVEEAPAAAAPAGAKSSEVAKEETPAAETTAKKPASARRPLLWMVEGTPRVFLYGTIHVPDARVAKHLPVVQQALDQSDALYTELAMDPQSLMQMQVAVLRRSELPEGLTLTKLFGEALHAKVAARMPPGVPLAAFENRKPWMVQMLLLKSLMDSHAEKRAATKKEGDAGEDGEAAVSEPPQVLDVLLFNAAQAAGKKVGGLETIDSQLDVFDALSLEDQVAMVADTIEMIEALEKPDEGRDGAGGGASDGGPDFERDPIGAMVETWLAGDDALFLQLFEEEIRKQGAGHEAFVEALLDKRNANMVAKIGELTKTDPSKTYFIAVGAGHMPGEKGIVRLLEAAGRVVRRIERGEELPAVAPAKAPAGK